MLFPLSEPSLLCLDLFGEALPELLFLLLELGVLELARLLLAWLASLHLCLAVVLVMELLGRRDEVKHVGANEERTQLAEVAVVLVLDLRDTPKVLTTLDDATVGGSHIFGGSDYGEGHGIDQDARVLGTQFIIGLNRSLVDANILSLDYLANLSEDKLITIKMLKSLNWLTRCLKVNKSF